MSNRFAYKTTGIGLLQSVVGQRLIEVKPLGTGSVELVFDNGSIVVSSRFEFGEENELKISQEWDQEDV